MKCNLVLNNLRGSIVATFIDLTIAATISVSFMASAQSGTLNRNREVDFSDSSPNAPEHLHDGAGYSKSSMPGHEPDMIAPRRWDYEWSSSAPVELGEGSMVRSSPLQPNKLRFGGITNVAFLLRSASGKPMAERPRPGSLPRLDRILLVGVAAVRLEDAVTTPLLFKNGAQEDILPDSIARSPLYMLALGALATSAQYRVSAALIHHNHGRIARATEIIHILSVGYFATQNIPAHEIKITR